MLCPAMLPFRDDRVAVPLARGPLTAPDGPPGRPTGSLVLLWYRASTLLPARGGGRGAFRARRRVTRDALGRDRQAHRSLYKWSPEAAVEGWMKHQHEVALAWVGCMRKVRVCCTL